MEVAAPPDPFVWWNSAVEQSGDRFLDWRALYLACCSGEEWRVPLEEARLVAEMGMCIALGEGRARDAVELGRQLFRHPEFSAIGWRERSVACFWLGVALLSAGEHRAGTCLFLELLAIEGWGSLPRKQMVTDALVAFCDRGGATEVVPGAVKELLAELLYDWPGYRRRSFEIAELRNLAELRMLLEEVRSR